MIGFLSLYKKRLYKKIKSLITLVKERKLSNLLSLPHLLYWKHSRSYLVLCSLSPRYENTKYSVINVRDSFKNKKYKNFARFTMLIIVLITVLTMLISLSQSVKRIHYSGIQFLQHDQKILLLGLSK